MTPRCFVRQAWHLVTFCVAGVALGDRHGPNVLCCGVCVSDHFTFQLLPLQDVFPGFETSRR